ncbi:hypothetical protein RHMOL_Rhmol13G0018500 [Rhododendron molle]|uniref:Uncharacterized protein n=1 Tax=Rhododendron molle TaxID=49168 RepID=A0ACC0L3E2_RHOML|nr:hypothetical protein RHMOL_Rhmol13G0018500 [Rhododendron molle]
MAAKIFAGIDTAETQEDVIFEWCCDGGGRGRGFVCHSSLHGPSSKMNDRCRPVQSPRDGVPLYASLLVR